MAVGVCLMVKDEEEETREQRRSALYDLFRFAFGTGYLKHIG
jgi:hypothetical protein